MEGSFFEFIKSEIEHCSQQDFDVDIFSRQITNPIDSLGGQAESSRNASPLIFQTLYHCIQQSLGLICASPKRAELFREAYYFLSDEVCDKSMCVVLEKNYENISKNFALHLRKKDKDLLVNYSDKTTQEFARYLSELSRANSSPSHSRNDEKIIYLVGDIGEGKTIFINYLLSTCQEPVFGPLKTIAIKVDMAYNISDQTDIQYLIARKSLRIIKEHYVNVEFDEKEVTAIMGRLGGDLQKKSEDYFWKSKNFAGNNIDELVTDHDDVKKIFNVVKNYIKECNNSHSFIFIIDGLDNFQRDVGTEGKFIGCSERLVNEIYDANKVDECYLIVSRKESFDYITAIVGSSGAKSEDRIPVNYRIRSPHSAVIVQNRINTLRSVIDIIKKNRNAKICEDAPAFPGYDEEKIVLELLAEHKDSIVKFFDKFLCSCFPCTDDKFELRKMFNKDNRTISNACKILLRDLLGHIERKFIANNAINIIKVYNDFVCLIKSDFSRELIVLSREHTYRTLMTNNFNYCINKFRYCVEKRESGSFFAPRIIGTHPDATLVPNLFQLNPGELIRQPSQSGCPVPYFLKIRILQLMIYCKQKLKRPITFDEICHTLSDFFGYDFLVVKSECRMLYSLRCIQKDNIITSEDTTYVSSLQDELSERVGPNTYIDIFNRYYFSPTSLGEYIVNNILTSYWYLENVIDNFYVHEDYSACFVEPISIHSDIYNINASDYLRKSQKEKFSRVVKFILLMKGIEEKETSLFMSRTKHKAFSFNKENHDNELLLFPEALNNIQSCFEFDVVNCNIYDFLLSH